MAGYRVEIEQTAVGNGNDTGRAVDRKASAGGVIEGVSNRIGSGVGVGGRGG